MIGVGMWRRRAAGGSTHICFLHWHTWHARIVREGRCTVSSSSSSRVHVDVQTDTEMSCFAVLGVVLLLQVP